MKDNKTYTAKELNKAAVNALKERGVNLEDIAEIVLFVQKEFQEDLTLAKCMQTVESVMNKREVLYSILTGIELDKAAEEGTLSEPILSIIKSDYKLYGVDEILPLGIVNLYGSIGLANFGHLDRTKPGIIGILDNNEDKVNTFLDDIIAGIAAAAASKVAHDSED